MFMNKLCGYVFVYRYVCIYHDKYGRDKGFLWTTDMCSCFIFKMKESINVYEADMYVYVHNIYTLYVLYTRYENLGLDVVFYMPYLRNQICRK